MQFQSEVNAVNRSTVKRYQAFCRGIPLLIVVGAFTTLSVAQSPSTAPVPEDTASSDEVAADAENHRAILKRMAEFLSQQQRFSVTLRIGYDVVQASGQKIEFSEIRTLLVSRPDRLRLDIRHSSGDQDLILFDGHTIHVYSGQDNVMAKTPQTGTLDQTISYFVKDLRMRLPLALLLVSTLPTEIEQRVRAVHYVEHNTIMEVPCDHLAAQTDTVDFQVCIAQGEQPLPQRIVITYKSSEGEPQFWAQFSDWNLKPALDDASFTFTPPEGAQEITFLATTAPTAPTDAPTATTVEQAPPTSQGTQP